MLELLTEEQLAQALANPDETLRKLDEADASESLIGFIRYMWPVLEPGRKLVEGWALEAICDHLQAVTDGDIRKLLINVPPGFSKPVHVDEPVLTSRGYIRLGDIRVGDCVMTHKGRFRPVTAVHEQGRLPLFCLKTFNGRSIRAAGDHPFLTPRGWVKLADITPNDYVGVPFVKEDFGNGAMRPEEARLLGYLVGDGCISQRSLAFVNMDADVIDDFIVCASKCGFYAYEVKHSNKNVKASKIILKSSRDNVRRGEQPPVLKWLFDHGLYKSTSYTKRIPKSVFASGQESIRNFIGAYWSCDGTISVRHVANKTTYLSTCCTVSYELAQDLLRAMACLNIDSRLRVHASRRLESKKQPDGIYISYHIQNTSRNEVAKFADMPGLCMRKNALAREAFLDRFDPNMFSDPVLSVESAGHGDCRCLTVDEDHSFTVNNVAVHNSLTTNVFWPAYEWGPVNRPYYRYFTASYSQTLTVRDNRRMRMLLQSERYFLAWGEHFALSRDEANKVKLSNTSNGFKIASSVDGTTMGERGDRVIIDDPNNTKQVEDSTEIDNALQFFTEVVPTRINDPETAAFVVIMQRTHERDVSGHIIAHDLGYEHLMLPMEFEPDRKCYTSIGFEDPRTEPGELLCPERFSRNYLETDLKPTLRSWGGEYAVAGQLQQRPQPRGGGMFQRDDFQIVELNEVPAVGETVRGWDLAATKDGKAAYTVGVKMRKGPRGGIYILDVRRDRLTPFGVEKLIEGCAESDGMSVTQDLPQDPGQAGKAQKAAYASGALAGRNFRFSPETGSKEDRARPYAAQCEAKNVYLVRAEWNDAFVAEHASFPTGAFKDQVDAASRAYAALTVKKRQGGAGGPIAIPL